MAKKKARSKPLLPRHIQKFLQKIERTHRGLGIPILLQYIFFVSKISVIWVAVKGSGKSVIIENTRLPEWLGWFDVDLYQVTKQELVDQLGYIENTTIVMRFTELAELSAYQRNLFMKMVGTLITSRNFRYKLSKEQVMQIVNCDTVVTAGIQPLTFSKMTRENIEWEQFAADRFIKIMLINPLRETSIKQPPEIDVDLLFQKYKPTPVRITDGAKKAMKKIQRLLSRQKTIWRSWESVVDLVTGFAQLLGKKTVDVRTVDLLYTMLYPYVHSFNELNIRVDLDTDRQIWSAGLELYSVLANYLGPKALEGVTKYELREVLDIRSIRPIERTLKTFQELGITLIDVEKRRVRVTNAEIYKTFVHLGKDIREFFNGVYDRLVGWKK